MSVVSKPGSVSIFGKGCPKQGSITASPVDWKASRVCPELSTPSCSRLGETVSRVGQTWEGGVCVEKWLPGRQGYVNSSKPNSWSCFIPILLVPVFPIHPVIQAPNSRVDHDSLWSLTHESHTWISKSYWLCLQSTRWTQWLHTTIPEVMGQGTAGCPLDSCSCPLVFLLLPLPILSLVSRVILLRQN